MLAFPFRSFRYLGTGLVVFGVCILGIAGADLIYTAVKYGKEDCGSSASMCNHDSLIYTWVASGVWGPIFVLIPTGALGMTFNRLKPGRLRLKRDAFGILGFLSVIVCLAIITLYSLGIVFGEDAFFSSKSGQFLVDEEVHFVLPLVTVILGSVAFFISGTILLFCSCCADIEEDDHQYRSRYDKYDRYERRSLDSYSDDYSVRDVPVRRVATVPPPALMPAYAPRPQMYSSPAGYMTGPAMYGSAPQMYGHAPQLYGPSYFSAPRAPVAQGYRVPLPWYGKGYSNSAY